MLKNTTATHTGKKFGTFKTSMCWNSFLLMGNQNMVHSDTNITNLMVKSGIDSKLFLFTK